MTGGVGATEATTLSGAPLAASSHPTKPSPMPLGSRTARFVSPKHRHALLDGTPVSAAAIQTLRYQSGLGERPVPKKVI